MNTSFTRLTGIIRYEFLMQWRRKTTIVVFAPVFLLFVTFALLSAEQVRQQTANAAATGLSPADVQRALTLTLLPAVWAVLHIMIILIAPIAVSDLIPKDRQLGMRELLDTLPLTSGVYVAGKLLSMWLVLIAGLGGIAIFTGIVWHFVFGGYDLATYASVWIFLAAPIALANPGLTMLLSAGQPTRRRALTVGVVLAVLTIITIRINNTPTLWDYLSPFRPIVFMYWIQGGTAALGPQTVSQANVFQSVLIALAEVLAVSVGSWAWLHRERNA